MGDTPETAAMALGKLIATVDGLVKTLDEQNKTTERNRIEQNAAAAKSREEFMDVFKGIRDDLKDQAKLIQEQAKLTQEHILEDNTHHSATLKLATWAEEVNPKIDALWDNQNKQKGAIVASGTIGSITGGAIVAIIEL